MQVLVRKSYRKHHNVLPASASAVEVLRSNAEANSAVPPHDAEAELDEDWLNVTERFAEDASTEQMQNIWGRVLAGEIRKPGIYSISTLNFLS